MTPQQLANELAQIFPPYRLERDGYDWLDLSFHEVVSDFMDYFKTEQSGFSEKQRRDFGKLINLCVDAGGILENAIATCFLEHLGQVGGIRSMKAYLSADAKDRLRA